MDTFFPYQTTIDELPREHSVDWTQFVSVELKENLSYGKADALLAMLGSIAPGLGLVIERWGAESKDGSAWIRSSEIRKLVGPAVPLKFVAEIRCTVTGRAQRIELGLAWRRIMSGSPSDPSDRICSVLLDIIGLAPDGRAVFTKPEVLCELKYMREASVDEGQLAIAALSTAAAKTESNG